MFDKLKQLKNLRELQKAAEEEKSEVEKQGIKVVVNGKMQIEEILLNPELAKEQQEAALKDCINEAVKKVQMNMAQKMMKM